MSTNALGTDILLKRGNSILRLTLGFNVIFGTFRHFISGSLALISLNLT
jgi:hypothetical protein